MSVNQKQLYKMLLMQEKQLQNELNPTEASVTEIPEDFNKVGWDLTVEMLEKLIVRLNTARENKGKRMTPQFYRAIFNRVVTANSDLDKMEKDIELSTQTGIDYSVECQRLNESIFQLNKQIAEKSAE